ncbi:uncharacterized protein NEMAJ01_1589 [Nematocida major]|uniref:uncharacterized protein n=1 Tax=Nematocida major TaxID=1912982 RepID=UPI002007EF25|nr:uncharacterized protein NEMAJ01_1589 [Nematocida major]KAH9386693.1 hypothetical protein NEMAJ01_1589 [Nematocida major]
MQVRFCNTKETSHAALLFAASAAVRLFCISHPDSVVFDENHYLDFIQMYFNREAVVDVHPPLGRLFAYFIAKWILGSKGAGARTSPYIGKAYEKTVLSFSYVVLRSASALASCISVVAGFGILRELGVRKNRAFLSSLLLLFDGAMHSIFRLFMIDSYVLAAISLILLSLVKMNKHAERTLQRPKEPKPRFSCTEASLAECGHASPKTVSICTSTPAQKLRLHRKKTAPAEALAKKCKKRPVCSPRSYFCALEWACVLGVALGIGASFKWAVLPMGGPIGVYLLTDLIRSKRKGCGLLRAMLPCVQGAAILALSASVYLSVFFVNFRVQDAYSEKTNGWFSFAYNATLKGSPHSRYKRLCIPAGAAVRIGIPEMSQFLSVNSSLLSVTKSTEQSPEWTLTPLEKMEYGAPLYIQHASGLFLSGEAPSFLSRTPSPMRILPAPRAALSIASSRGLYLNPAGESGAAWTKHACRLLVLYGGRESSSPAESASIESSEVTPQGFFQKLWEANKVMYQCNSTLSGTHTYKSFPREWVYSPRPIHLWSGAVSETAAEHSQSYNPTAQIFLVANPLIVFLAAVSLCLYLVHALTTKIKRRALSHVIILAAYLCNYFPYFLLSRETYTHHYIPSYYVSILVLGYLLGQLPVFFHGMTAVLCGALFAVQAPLVLGTRTSYEMCRIALWFSGQKTACDLFDAF